ncbi:MAG TPA: hypothetical protein VME20_04525 [Acidimicrobiales bacterium]|nr:hypothetical protein [Acidimicrobiales bacterium]
MNSFTQGTAPVWGGPTRRYPPIDLTAPAHQAAPIGYEAAANDGATDQLDQVVRVDAKTTRLPQNATTTQMEVNFRFAKNVAATTGQAHSVIFWDACTDPLSPRWWVRTYYPNGTWGEDTLEGHQSGSLAGTPPPIFVAAHQS